MTGDEFTPYQIGLTRLLEKLGEEHRRYIEALTLQSRLLNNIAKAREYGDALQLQHDRAQIVNALNRLAQEELRISFNKLCEEAPNQRERTSTLAGCTTRIGSWIFKAEVVVVTVVLLVIVAGLCGTVGRPVVERWVAVVFGKPTPTATVVHLTDAHISFTVTLIGGGELEIPAGGILSLAPGDGVLIDVNVTVDHSPFPRDLTYQYLAPRGSIPEELTGPSASYAAPEQSGPDVITARIRDWKTGDEIVRSISVFVEEKSP